LDAAKAKPEHIIQMTWYFTDREAYKSRMREIGAVYREIIGRHFPPMAAVQVVALMEDRAKIEIQSLAVVPD
jgi:enamine deaminase RidA (YjgF/YER057c/UK114 family)